MVNLNVLICCLATMSYTRGQFPPDIERCFYHDERCLINTVQDILKNHNQGNPALHLIKLDPLEIRSLNFDRIPGSPVSVDLSLKDATLTGISRGTVTKVVGFEREPINLEFDLEVRVPKIVLNGTYNIEGEVLSVPITGNGTSTITFQNMIIASKVKTRTATKNGKKYLNILVVEMDLKPSRVRYSFENLFNGDNALGERMNEFLNQNWDLVFAELKPLVDESLAKIVMHIASGPFSKIPYNELFLPF